MNHSRKSIFVLFLCGGILLLFSLSSCRIIKRNGVVRTDISQKSWENYLDSVYAVHPNVVLRTSPFIENVDQAFILENPLFKAGDMTGNLILAENLKAIELPDGNNFSQGRIPKEERKRYLNSVVIYVKSEIQPGSASISYENIHFAETYSTNKGATAAANTAVGILGTVAAFTAFIVIACNCPRVYAHTDTGDVYQGTILTGAFSKALEREDKLILNGLNPTDGKVKISLRNELPEEEYIDEVKLFKTKLEPDFQLASDASGSLFSYKNSLAPIKARTGENLDLLASIRSKDGVHYGFEELNQKQELNAVILEFDKQKVRSDQSKLILLAKQSKWLETVSEYFFSLFGTAFDRWTARMDKVNPEKYYQNLSNQGVSLNAYLETENGWESIGTFHNAGTLQFKEFGLDLDLSKHHGDQIRIKLTSAYKYWELDYAGISDSWTETMAYEEVPMYQATNDQSEDISSLIGQSDENYAVLPDDNSSIEFVFEHTARENEVYVLQGSGYYHHQRDYQQKPNKAMLKKLKAKGHLATHELSKELDLAQQLVSIQNNR